MLGGRGFQKAGRGLWFSRRESAVGANSTNCFRGMEVCQAKTCLGQGVGTGPHVGVIIFYFSIA